MKKILVVLLLLLGSLWAAAQEADVTVVIETNLGTMKAILYKDTPQHRANFIRLAKQGHYDGTLFYRVIRNFMIQGGSSASRNAVKGQQIGFGKPVTIDAEIRPDHYHKKGALAAPRQPDRVNFFKESDISQFYIVHGKKYTEEEMDLLEKSVNTPIRNAIRRKVYTPEKKALLDSLRKEKKVAEFREIAERIKQDIAFEWELNPDKLYMTDRKKADYVQLGGVYHLDKEYTVFGEVVEGLEVIDKIAKLPTDGSDRPLQDVTIKVKIIEN